MKNIKKEWYIIVILLIIISSIILVKPLNDLDEIWNYNFAKNVLEGRMPYKDFNMIQMPLLPNICSIFLGIFGNELIVMRILAILLCTSILFLVYKILEFLKVNKQLNYAFIIFLIYIFKEHFRIDYNFFVLFNLLVIIYIELKTINKNTPKIDILLGIFAGICICSKQTTGVFISIALVAYPILKVTNIKEFKNFIKKAICRITGICIPLITLAIYFTINNLWYDFIDYCVLGIKTFSNSIPYINLIKNAKFPIQILSIIVPVFLIILFVITIVKRKETKAEYKNFMVILVFSIASMIVVFPISDTIHFLVGALPSMIGIVYAISIAIKKLRYEKAKIFVKEYLKMFIALITIIISITSIIIIYKYILDANQYTKLKHFWYIPNSEDQVNDIKELSTYIQNENKNVYILDATAALYTIPIDRYTKNYDMFLKGNLGGTGEDGIIEDLNNKTDIVILIKNEKYSRNWQNPEKVRKYIINNMKKSGEIGYFDIYEK